jgi:heme A synthase
MQIPLIITLSLHVLSSVFWAGSSFTLARTGGLGGEKLFRPQMGAAVIAILTGAYLGHAVHAGAFGTAEKILAAGALTALVAAGVQGAIGGRAVRSLDNGTADEAGARSRIAVAQRIAAALLAVTAVCMGAARYA